MTRDWHDEYDKAAQEYHEARVKFKEADSARAAALATMNRAERELNRLFALRFNTPGVTVSSPLRPKCKLCGLEDGACICAHIPAQPQRSLDVEAVHDAIALALTQEGMTFSGVRQAARDVLALSRPDRKSEL